MSVSKTLKQAKKNLVKKEAAKNLPSKGELRKIVAMEKADQIKDQKPSFTPEEAEKLRMEEKSNVFVLSNGLYLMLERTTTALDELMFLSRNKVGNGISKEDALKIYYLENIIKAVTAADEHMRKHHIKVIDGVSELDNIHHLYHSIISNMDKMKGEKDLNMLLKASNVIAQENRYMWIDSESDFKNNIQVAIQHGMDLAIGGKRKKATLKDVEEFLSPKPTS